MKTGVSVRIALPTTTGIDSAARPAPGASAKAQSRNDGMLIAISGPAGKVGQPAQALERQHDLADARRDRHVERGERVLAQHAVRQQAVPGLEPPQALGQWLRIPVVDRARGRRREIAQPDEPGVQRRRAGVGVADDDLAARRRERRQRRAHGLRGEDPVSDSSRFSRAYCGKVGSAAAISAREVVARHRLAQLGHERRRPSRARGSAARPAAAAPARSAGRTRNCSTVALSARSARARPRPDRERRPLAASTRRSSAPMP